MKNKVPDNKVIDRVIEETLNEVYVIIDKTNEGFNVCEKSKLKTKIKKEFKH